MDNKQCKNLNIKKFNGIWLSETCEMVRSAKQNVKENARETSEKGEAITFTDPKLIHNQIVNMQYQSMNTQTLKTMECNAAPLRLCNTCIWKKYIENKKKGCGVERDEPTVYGRKKISDCGHLRAEIFYGDNVRKPWKSLEAHIGWLHSHNTVTRPQDFTLQYCRGT